MDGAVPREGRNFPAALARVCGPALMAAFVLGLMPAPVRAQVRIEADYVATLAGLTVGKGGWTVQLDGDSFFGQAHGGTSGILSAFSSGSGTSAARATLNGDKVVAASYQARLDLSKKVDTTKIVVADGNVTDFSVEPEPPDDPNRIPVTDDMRRGVKDPMSAAFVRVGGKGSPVSEEACTASSAVFDGQRRFDVSLEFRRVEQVKAEHGYAGPAVVCGVRIKPIGGHDPGRKAIKYIAEQRNIEVWLVPVAGTRMLVPFRVSSPTPVGPAVVAARRFVVSPMPIPASMKGR